MTNEQRAPIRQSAIGQLADSREVLEMVLTATEVVLGGEFLVGELQRAIVSGARYSDRPGGRLRTGFFRTARTRLEYQKSRSGEKLATHSAAFDATLERTLGSLQVRSVAEILARAEDVQRRVDDLVAQAPGGSGGNDETLPGEGGGGGVGGGTGSGGTDSGSGAPPPPETFEQYPLEAQQAAQSAYEPRIGEPASIEISTTTTIVVEVIETGASSGQTASEVQQRINSEVNSLNATVSGIVVGVAASFGGVIGAALIALALAVMQPAISQAEAFFAQKFSEFFGT
jgi:hypothetical protein